MKKISVLILGNDSIYNRNVVFYFRSHYNDEIRIVLCESPDNVIDFIRVNNVNLLLVDEMFKNDVPEKASVRCNVAYLEGTSGHTIKDNTFCKYISGSDLYKNIVFLCSQGMEDFETPVGYSSTLVRTFVSVNGNGATTLAIAFAARAAASGKKVLLIGLDGFTDYAPLFSVRSGKGLSDIIYATKSRSANVQMVSKSVAIKGENDVYFIDKCRLCDDISELSKEETDDMLDKIVASAGYEVVVFDVNFFFNHFWSYAVRKSTRIYSVCENSETSIRKMNNFFDDVCARDLRDNTETAKKLVLILNKSKKSIPCIDVKCQQIKNVPFQNATDYSGLIHSLSQDSCWEDEI